MANDIAELGIKYDSANLKKAKANLEALVPSAAKVEKATLAVARASEAQARASLAAVRANTSATAAEIRNAEAAVRQAAAVTATARANLAASGALNTVGKASQTAATGMTQAGGAAQNAAAGVTAIGTAAQNSTNKIARLGSAANDNLNAVQATPANIAAQFQDIGVTAAAGMNPMLIALQQGTQLSVAFSNGFGGIGAALKQIFSPLALGTIGMVALVAGLIQMVDWVSVGKSALNGLADALDVAAPYAVALAAGLALINAPAILTGIAALTKGMWGLAAGMLAAVGIPALIVAGLVAIVAAANYFREDLTKILGFDIVKAAKDGVNYIIGFFVGGYNAIVKSWGMIAPAIDDILAQAVQYSRNRIEQMINSAIDGINSLLAGLPDWMKIGGGQIVHVKFDGVPNPNAGAAAKVGNIVSSEMSAAQGVDYVGKGVKYIEDGAKYLSGKLRGFADGLGKDKGEKDKSGGAASGGKTDLEKFADIVADADRRIASLQAESQMIGMYGEALYTAKARMDMLTEASRKGLTLDKEQIAIIDQKAQKIGELTAANEKATYLEDLRVTGAETIAGLKAEQAALGLTGEELRKTQIEYQMLADARRKNIDLTPAEIASIRAMSEEQAGLEEAIRKQREAIEFDRNATRGFFRDFMQGARDGKGAWQSFADAFNNVMDRIIDKLLNDVLDAIFQVNSAAQGGGGGGGGGLFGFLGKAVGLIGGGGGFGSAQSINDSVLGSLKAEFGSGSGIWRFGGGPQPDGTMSFAGYAKGDAFTNSIVSRPTAFAFGKGGANLGIMGEAGDEAIMPLQRGPDGSLGVQMYGGVQTPSAPQPGPITFDMRGAIVTEDLLAQMNQMAAERADVAVVRERTRNTRAEQRRFNK